MVEEYRRKRFLEDLNDAYAELRADPEAWREIQVEMAEWEALSDGLAGVEGWTEEGLGARR